MPLFRKKSYFGLDRNDRLILRRYQAADLQELHVYLSDPEVVKLESHRQMTREEVEENLKIIRKV